MDGSGNAYVTGYTDSTDFPTANPLQPTNHGNYDAFVAKLNAGGTALVYSTYLGGSSDDESYGIAVNGSGNAYVTGFTSSIDFPTANPLQPAYHGNYDAFVAKLNASGTALVYSTCLGGSSIDWGYGIGVDVYGNAYVTGFTNSLDFPTANPLQPTYHGGMDAFVAKLNASGTALVYSTYLGGSSNDWGYGIAVDLSGNAYVTGFTDSTDFPTANPLQSTNRGDWDAFVAKIPFLSGTTTTLISSSNPSVFGQSVTFTATVSGDAGTPSGTVTFSDGSTSLGTAPLSGTTATFTTSSLAVSASHSITASYSGDTNFTSSTSATLLQTVKDGLIVSSFMAGSTGFSAVFRHPLNLGTVLAPILNLYDNSTGSLGPADVTLVGAATGPIRGSLVVDQNNTRITFIETGQAGVLGSAAPGTLFGVLPNDTYTVTLRSASNGFQDTNGNLLDGNADGTPGDNFVTTFVVNNSSNSVTVTLPDFARGAGQLVNVPNTVSANDTFTNGLPLRLYNGISFTGSTTSGNQTVRVLTTAGLVNGDTVTGPGIPAGTTISAMGTSDRSPCRRAPRRPPTAWS